MPSCYVKKSPFQSCKNWTPFHLFLSLAGSVNPFVMAQSSCSDVFLLLDKQFQKCEGPECRQVRVERCAASHSLRSWSRIWSWIDLIQRILDLVSLFGGFNWSPNRRFPAIFTQNNAPRPSKTNIQFWLEKDECSDARMAGAPPPCSSLTFSLGQPTQSPP